MADRLDEYIHDSLKRFIQYHADQGYSKESLTKCLSSYGYSRPELEKVFDEVHINPKRIDKAYSTKELDAEAYYYLRGILSKYMKDQEKMGFDIKDVKKALIRYGHHKEIVNDAHALLVSRQEIRISREALVLVGAVVISIFTFIMASTLQVTFMEMFRLISPAFVTVLILYILADKFYHHKAYVPVFSIAASMVLFIGIIGINEDPTMNDAVLLVINAVLATVVSIAFMAAHVPKPKTFKENRKNKNKDTSPPKITEKEKDIKSKVEE